MVRQILLAFVATGATVIIHAAGTALLAMRFSRIWNRKSEAVRPEVLMPLIRLITALLFLHVIEMSVWGGAFALLGVLPDFEASLYFSMTSYTTVGYGDVVPSLEWRLLGPIEATVGVLMLGWSTGVIVTSLQRLYSPFVELP